MTRDASALANEICGCSTKEQHQRDIALIEADRTASEQRGYDRAIAEVVAWLREQGITSCEQDGWWETSTGAEYGQSVIDAIEAGEHKP